MAIKNDIVMNFLFFELIHDQNFSESSETIFKERHVPLQIRFV